MRVARLALALSALACSPAAPAGPTQGEVLAPNAPAVIGREALAAFWGQVLGSGIRDAKLTAEEVTYTGGDFATEVGAATLTTKDGRQADEAKYVVLWKKTEAASAQGAP